MGYEYQEFRIKSWNGKAIDRDKVFGMAKSLLAAYPGEGAALYKLSAGPDSRAIRPTTGGLVPPAQGSP